MKLSTTTSCLFDAMGYERGIELAAAVGFDALDLNLIEPIYSEDFSDKNLEKTCRMLKDTAATNGICFNQAHAPFPCYSFTNDEYNKRVKPAVNAAVKAAGLVGAEQIVVHPVECPDKSVQKQFNIELYEGLIPVSREYGVKIALENMWGYNNEEHRICPNVCSWGRELAEYFDELDERYFTVCLDTGHCGLIGQTAHEAVYELGGKRLHALHVHDNDNVKDLHTIPYQGKLDWEAFMKALADIGYDGDLTYEVGGAFLNCYKDKPQIFAKAFELLAVTGKYLIGRFDFYSAK